MVDANEELHHVDAGEFKHSFAIYNKSRRIDSNVNIMSDESQGYPATIRDRYSAEDFSVRLVFRSSCLAKKIFSLISGNNYVKLH